MRAVPLGALCLGIFSSSLAYTHQEQSATAEQAFKNIQSFKGKKASEIIPAMQFMSASLKVKCEYCHTSDFSSDTKPEKGSAREMIAMQNDINQRHFGGRNQVTCATCHGGKTRPLAFPPTEGVEVRARRSSSVTSAQVLALFAKAVGAEGDRSLSPSLWQGFGMTGGAKVKAEALFDNGKFRLTSHTPQGEVKIGYNGASAWYENGAAKNVMPPDVTMQFVNQETLFTGPASLPKWKSPVAGTAKIGARDMLVLSGTLPETSTRLSIFFDKQTGLPARTAYYYPTILGTMAQINDYSDYRKLDGLQLPMTIGNHSGEMDEVHHFTSVIKNPKINPAVFDPPK